MTYQSEPNSMQLFCDMCKERMIFKGATGTKEIAFVHYICPVCFHRNTIKKVMRHE